MLTKKHSFDFITVDQPASNFSIAISNKLNAYAALKYSTYAILWGKFEPLQIKK